MDRCVHTTMGRSKDHKVLELTAGQVYDPNTEDIYEESLLALIILRDRTVWKVSVSMTLWLIIVIGRVEMMINEDMKYT